MKVRKNRGIVLFIISPSLNLDWYILMKFDHIIKNKHLSIFRLQDRDGYEKFITRIFFHIDLECWKSHLRLKFKFENMFEFPPCLSDQLSKILFINHYTIIFVNIWLTLIYLLSDCRNNTCPVRDRSFHAIRRNGFNVWFVICFYCNLKSMPLMWFLSRVFLIEEIITFDHFLKFDIKGLKRLVRGIQVTAVN